MSTRLFENFFSAKDAFDQHAQQAATIAVRLSELRNGQWTKLGVLIMGGERAARSNLCGTYSTTPAE